MNGEEKLKELDNILEEYEQLHGIHIVDSNIDKYLHMSREDIGRLDAESCTEIAFEIARHSIYVQQQYNKERGRVKWCTATIHYYCVPEWKNHKEYFKDDIRIAAISQKENFDHIRKLIKIKNHAEQRVERLYGMAAGIKYLSDILLEQAKTKRYIGRN